METQNYAQFADAPTDDAFKQLAVLADRQLAAEREVVEAEKALAGAQERLKQIKEVELPLHMRDVLGLKEITLRDGRRVEIEEVIQASITEANKGAAFAWLRGNKHGNLIKHQLTVDFAKGQENKALALVKMLAGLGHEVGNKQSVHAQTLKAFVREKLKNGEVIPEDLFSVHRQQHASIKARE